MDYKILTAPCGRDCFNCFHFLAGKSENYKKRLANQLDKQEDEVVCKGCREEQGECNFLKVAGLDTPCKLFICASDKNIDFCYECDKFPCQKLHPLKDGAGDYIHNLKVFNLCNIQRDGVEKWGKMQAKKSFNRYFNDKIDSCY